MQAFVRSSGGASRAEISSGCSRPSHMRSAVSAQTISTMSIHNGSVVEARHTT